MKVSKEELLHIAELSNLKIDESEVDSYLKNLQDILDFAETIDKANVDGVETSANVNKNGNVFRKDEVVQFDNVDGLLDGAPEKSNNMYKIPQVIQ